MVPTLSQEVQRNGRIQRVLAHRLPDLFPEVRTKLPYEIWDLVLRSDYKDDNEIVKRCALETAATLWTNRHTCSAQLDLRRDIWAHYMFIDGVRYVERLTHAPGSHGPDSRTCVQILQGVEPGTLALQKKTVVYVLEDHLGVRQLVFATPEDDFSTLALGNVREPWWRTVSFLPGQQLRALSDDLKIRNVRAVAVAAHDPDKVVNKRALPMFWRVPTAPSAASVAKVRLMPDFGSGSAYFMDSMTCNEPGITAYSAFWWDDKLVAFHAHRRSDRSSDLDTLYRDATGRCRDGIWSHFPVADDERLVDLFLRRPRPILRGMSSCLLLFRTNRGRIWTIRAADEPVGEDRAPDNRAHSSFRDPHHVCSLEAADAGTGGTLPTRIHYSVSPVGFDVLALAHAGPFRHLPSIPLPHVTRWGCLLKHVPGPVAFGPYMASTVCLDGLASVTPSYKWSGESHRVVMCGLLFRYVDGVQSPPAVLGEFRLDRVGTAIDLTSADSLYLLSKPNDTAPLRASSVDGDDTLDRSPLNERGPEADLISVTATASDVYSYHRSWNWHCLPLTGLVDMLYSHRHGCIYSPTMTKMEAELRYMSSPHGSLS